MSPVFRVAESLLVEAAFSVLTLPEIEQAAVEAECDTLELCLELVAMADRVRLGTQL